MLSFRGADRYVRMLRNRYTLEWLAVLSSGNLIFVLNIKHFIYSTTNSSSTIAYVDNNNASHLKIYDFFSKFIPNYN